MPRTRLGQQYTFAIEIDEDQRFKKWRWVNLKKGDTVQKVAARYGHPEDARRIADENSIHSVRSVLERKRLRVPGELTGAASFHVLAGDTEPEIVDGYAKLGVLDKPERVGNTTFLGYNPIVMEVPVRFEGPQSAASRIEDDIELLERMAGRGNFKGAGVGPPPVIRLSATDNRGNVIPLIPRNYQWSLANKNAPAWRIGNIEWQKGARRNDDGRFRQLAVVTVQQATKISLLTR